MARLKRRTDGYYARSFVYRGKRYSVYAKKLGDLEKKVVEKKEKLEHERERRNAELTLDEYFNEFQQERVFNKSVKPSTVATHKRVYRNRIKPEFGNTLIVDIEKRAIKQFQRQQAEKYKPGTVNQTMAVLSAVLSGAVEDDILTVNPCRGIHSLKDDSDILQNGHRALSTEELQNFFKYAVDSSWYCDLFYFLLWTGCRISEALALNWTDINYKKRQISITKTLTTDENEVLVVGKSPKTQSGKRTLPMNDKLIKLLKKHRADQKALFGDSVASIDTLVFLNQWGKMARRNSVASAIEFTIKRAEADGVTIDRFGAHAFRDTYATIAADSGMRPETLQRLLGHSDIRETMNTYYHSTDDVREKEYNLIKFAV